MDESEISREPVHDPTVFDVLKYRGFVHLWIAQIFSQIASNTLLFVLALRLYQATQSNTAVSGLFLVYGVPSVLFGMAAGTVVDKIEKKRILFACDMSRFVIALILSFVPTNVPVIYMLTLINSIINQFYVPAEAPTIPHLVPKSMVVPANSLFSFTYYSSLALGSLLSGPVLRILGPREVFWVLAVCYLFAAGNVTRVPRFSEVTRPVRQLLTYSLEYIVVRLWANIKEGFLYVRQSKVLLDALLLLAGTQIILSLLATLGPGFADKVMEIDVRDSSLFVSGPVVIGIILGALWVGNMPRKIKPKRLMNIGVLSAGIILVCVSVLVRLSRISSLEWLLPRAVAIPLSITLFFLLGIANSFLDVPANSVLQEEASGELRGRVFGMLAVAVGGIGILPVVASGVLADTIGVGKVVFALGLCITLYGIRRLQYNKS